MSGVIEKSDFDNEYLWTVDNSFAKFNTKVHSPIISLRYNNQLDTKWRIIMARKRRPNFSESYLTLYVENLNDFNIRAHITIKIISYERDIILDYDLSHHLFTTGQKCIPTPTEDDIKISYESYPNTIRKKKISVLCKIIIDSTEINYQSKNKFCRLKYLDKLEDLFMDQESSDIIIEASGETFYVHKNILGIFSPVFKAMFQHDFLEKTKNKVEIVDIEPKVLKEFLRFIYTGKVNNLNEIEKELLYAAEKYSVKGLKILCEDNMSKKMSLEKAIEYLEVALKCNAVDLKNNAIQLISAHSSQLWNKQELKSLGKLYPEILYEIMNFSVELSESKIKKFKSTE